MALSYEHRLILMWWAGLFVGFVLGWAARAQQSKKRRRYY